MVSAFGSNVVVNFYLNESQSYNELRDKIFAIPDLDQSYDVSPNLELYVFLSVQKFPAPSN